MKAIEVTIKAVFEIPDSWEIVGNGEAIKTEDKLNIFTVDFLEERKEENLFQTGNDEFFNSWVDRMETEVCKIVEL